MEKKITWLRKSCWDHLTHFSWICLQLSCQNTWLFIHSCLIKLSFNLTFRITGWYSPFIWDYEIPDLSENWQAERMVPTGESQKFHNFLPSFLPSKNLTHLKIRYKDRNEFSGANISITVWAICGERDTADPIPNIQVVLLDLKIDPLSFQWAGITIPVGI